MTSSDKIIIAVIFVCAIAGLVQTTITKRNKNEDIPKAVMTSKANQEDGTSPDTLPRNEKQQRFDYEHNIQINTGANLAMSLQQQRELAVREKKHQTAQQYDQRNIDYYTAREGMKDILLKESYEGSLNEEEKWKLIESGALPW